MWNKLKLESILRKFNIIISDEEYDINLADIGMDSVVYMELIIEIENEMNIEFENEELEYEVFNTFNKIYNLVQKKYISYEKEHKKKVYLINLPFDGQDERQIQSLGMAYLAAELVDDNVDVKIFDGCGVDRNVPVLELFNGVKFENPDLIGFYVIEHNYADTIKFINELSPYISSKIFLGGPQVSFLYENIMICEKNIDFILVGESEGKLLRILNGEKQINGLVYREGEKVFINKMECENICLDELSYPIREIDNKCLLTKEKFGEDEDFIVPISTSRGCPYHCTFCTIPALVKNQKIAWRFRSAENILDEIKQVYDKYSNICIRFIDDNFLVDMDRAYEICEGISNIGKIQFSFAARVDSIIALDEKKLEEMRNFGLSSVELGIENFNDSVLERYKKGTTATNNKMAIQKLIAVGIIPGIDFIMFDPWTTRSELEENYKAIVELKLDNYYPNFLTNRLYPFSGCIYDGVINMKNYFENEDVKKIYDRLVIFNTKYRCYKDYLEEQDLNDFIYHVFCKLPYSMFSLLIKNPDIDLEECSLIKNFEKLLDIN